MNEDDDDDADDHEKMLPRIFLCGDSDYAKTLGKRDVSTETQKITKTVIFVSEWNSLGRL